MPMEMTEELKDVFSGKLVPKVKVVNYNTPEKKAKLKEVLEVQTKIMERTKVNWVRLNEFQVTL